MSGWKEPLFKHFGSLFKFFARLRQVVPVVPFHLPDEARLESMLVQLEGMAFEDRYPLQSSFYQYLLGCQLLLPIPAGADVSKGIPIIALENSEGETGLPIFTQENNLNLWMEDSLDEKNEKNEQESSSHYLALPFDTLCRYALDAKVDYIVINAAGPYGCEISFHDFSYLAEGLVPAPGAQQQHPSGHRKAHEMIIEKATPMRLAVCNQISPGLVTRLHQLFQHHQALISRVYLFDVAFNEGPLQPALGVRVPEGYEDKWEMELWPNMQAVLYEMLERREVVNVFLLNQADSMEAQVRTVVEPIYENHPA